MPPVPFIAHNKYASFFQLGASREDLEAMTEAELEDICVARGFKLVNDNAEELTKQDYVEAAQRCLAIEQEM